MRQIGLIGWGYWGRNYAKYFGPGLGATLSWVCDLRQDMLLEAQGIYPHLRTTRDVGDLVKASLDGVIIASPASIHHKLAMAFMGTKTALLIEKPLTNTLATARELEEEAHKSKTKILVGHTFLYNQSVRYLKERISKGSFGQLYYLEFKRQSYGPIRDDVNIVWDFAPHDLAIAKYLLGGKPLSVHATAEKYSRNGMEDIAVIVLRYPGNVLVNINVAWLYPVKIRTLTLLGDKKMAVFEDTNSNEPLKIYDTSLAYPKEHDPSGASFRLGDIFIPRMKPVDPLETQLRHFISYIDGKEKPLTPVAQGVEVVMILEAITASLRTGKEVIIKEWE